MALPQPGVGLAGLRTANLTGPAPQQAAAAPQVQTQARPNPSPVAQAVPPEMQALQAQLAQAAQANQQQAPNAMQQILSMLGPGAGAMGAGAPMGLGALMQPQQQPGLGAGQMPQMAQAAMTQAPGSGAVAAPSPLTPVQQMATAMGPRR